MNLPKLNDIDQNRLKAAKTHLNQPIQTQSDQNRLKLTLLDQS